MSALFSALSDLLSNTIEMRTCQNEFDYIIQVTSEFLTSKISNNIYSHLINIRNVKLNIENMSKRYKAAIHPNEYCKRKINMVFNMLLQFCFTLSIAAFILSPFPLISLWESFSVSLSLSAFSLMCLNLYLEEIILDIRQKKTYFFNNEQLIIQMAYPDFTDYLIFHLNYYEDYIAILNMQGGEFNADT